MSKSVSIAAVGHATSVFLVVSYLLCVAFDLAVPGMAMYEAWQPLLPGFKWISWSSFFLGLIETWLWGWYIALLWVPLYRLFSDHRQTIPEE